MTDLERQALGLARQVRAAYRLDDDEHLAMSLEVGRIFEQLPSDTYAWRKLRGAVLDLPHVTRER